MTMDAIGAIPQRVNLLRFPSTHLGLDPTDLDLRLVARACAVVVLIGENNSLIMQERDRLAAAEDPGAISFFGGGVEAAETFETAALRELDEELGIAVAAASLHLVHRSIEPNALLHALVDCVVFRCTERISLKGLDLREGAAIALVPVDRWDTESKLSRFARRVLEIC